ncbi:MAG: efflux RND transporter periplasmic adaptor subunit [Planctomycetota bacterium]|nr:efflux RND transporter periplasmic adaptor subunit [Planctomycetota bacterium]
MAGTWWGDLMRRVVCLGQPRGCGTAAWWLPVRRAALWTPGGVLCVLLLVAAGCGKKEPPEPPPPPAVTVAVPVRKTVAVYGEYVGLVDSPRTIELVVRVEGVLKEINFQEGSEVEKGTLMFVIDPAPYEVALQKAKAQLLNAQAALESAKVALTQAKNVKDIEVDKANVARDEAALVNAEQVAKDARVAVGASAMARSQLDSAEAGLKQAAATLEASRAKLAQSQADYQTRVAQADANVAQADASEATAKATVADAELNLSYTRIYTPVGGRVGRANVKIGRLVGHNEPTPIVLAAVSQVDPIYVDFTISEREMFELRRLGDQKNLGRTVVGKLSVNMILEDGSLYPHEGKINFADRMLDPSTGTLKVRAEFPNPSGFLRPGNYAKIRMVLTELRDALVITERALGTDQSGMFVLVVDQKNMVEYRPVKVGPKADGGMVVVEAGLKPDDHVVVKGLQRARPGREVSPTLDGAAPVAAVAPPAAEATAAPKPAKE